ncbi:helix-turn-helix domain-containing protein [Streptomyces griseofuscus]|uniref:Helix-turn-helix domain-containing protein n=1 Tax=Streptomyces griseofuscus TaxID=146922 RepID=A0A7H1PQV3_9ACTN|nr:helix-turn-helix domain-containing protein [Streptomyces griseofuscus]
MSELFDALVASRSPLPPAQECERLRVAHGLTPDEAAAALKVRRAPVPGGRRSRRRPSRAGRSVRRMRGC